MSFKTILVHVDESKHAEDCIRIASEIALAENAHLIGAAMTGVSRYLYRDQTITDNDPGLIRTWRFSGSAPTTRCRNSSRWFEKSASLRSSSG